MWRFTAGLYLVSGCLLCLAPLPVFAQQAPPVGQSLVREGTLAVKLQVALGIGSSDDEVQAETNLSNAGILPRNGWIADYPVTPDIVGELQDSVENAAEAGKIKMEADDALNRLENVTEELGLPVTPYTGEAQGAPPASENYPNPDVISNYYYNEGPPVITYYTPPPDFYYLYAWVPFPFWYTGLWFPGFFVLHDFQRYVFFDHRARFVSNHFNDVRTNRVFRIDPVTRFRGRTYAGIGITRRRGFVSTGVNRSQWSIFNNPRRYVPPGRYVSPAFRGGGRFAPSTRSGGIVGQPSPGGRIVSPPPGAGRMIAPPVGGRTFSPGRSIAPPSGGIRGGVPRGRGR